jgi:hypothetical protein
MNTEVVIDYELLKLNYLKNYFPDNQYEEYSTYFRILNSLDKQYKDKKGYEAILYQKALFYFELVKKNTDETKSYQEYAQKSNDIFKQLAQKPDTFFGKNALYYLSIINEKGLKSRDNETYYTPDKNLLVPVNYKNLDTVYVSIYKIKPKYFYYKNFSYYTYSNFYKNDSLFYDFIYKKAELVKIETIKLINPKDFRWHSTDILLKNIDVGNYYLVFHYETSMTTKSHLRA